MRLVLAVFALLLTPSCSHITGAIPLTPGAKPEEGVWVFIASDNQDWTGIYRCRDVDSGKAPECHKAKWGNR